MYIFPTLSISKNRYEQGTHYEAVYFASIDSWWRHAKCLVLEVISKKDYQRGGLQKATIGEGGGGEARTDQLFELGAATN